MPIRITGLNSGLDTDSIIKSLSSSYQTKIDNVKRKQSDIQYKMDILEMNHMTMDIMIMLLRNS